MERNTSAFIVIRLLTRLQLWGVILPKIIPLKVEIIKKEYFLVTSEGLKGLDPIF